MEYKATASFENANFLLNRGNHSINDQETFEADFQFIYNNEKNLKIDLHPRVKVDFLDISRNRYIPNESYIMLYSPHFELSGGLQLIPWGVSSFFNPTDVLNRKDFEDNYYNPESLGELILSLKGIIDKAGPIEELTFQAIVLPLFQESPLPENDTRFAIQGNAGGVPYTLLNNHDTLSNIKEIGGALSISGTIPPVDISLHYYHGPEKNPGSLLVIDGGGALRLQPFYYLIDMIGFNIEAPIGNFVLHFESTVKITSINGARRHDINFEQNNGVPESYAQFVPGLEYTFNNVLSGDLTLIFEYLGEKDLEYTMRNFRPFKADFLFGIQYDLLNAKETRINGGVIKDLDNNEAIFILEASSKIYKELKFGLEGVFVHRDTDNLTPISFFDNNSYILARLSYSFGGRF